MKAQGEMKAEHSQTLAQLNTVNINILHAKRNEEGTSNTGTAKDNKICTLHFCNGQITNRLQSSVTYILK